MATADIAAIATAEASPANAMTCVKPFTIPDDGRKSARTRRGTRTIRYDAFDNKGDPAARLRPTSTFPPTTATSTRIRTTPATTTAQNKGMQLVLRAGHGQQHRSRASTSRCAMTERHRAATTTAGTSPTATSRSTSGATPWSRSPATWTGPTVQGIGGARSRGIPAPTGTTARTPWRAAPSRNQSPRIFPIPLYDPSTTTTESGTDATRQLQTANWIGFFVESIQGNRNQRPHHSDRRHPRQDGAAGMQLSPSAIRLVQ